MFSDSFLWQQLSLRGQSAEAPGWDTQKPSNTPLISWDCDQVRGDAETWQTPLSPALASCEGCYHIQQFLDKRGILNGNFETFFFFLVPGINTFFTSLLFEIYSFDFQTHFQPCIMCSNPALLVYLPHKCCCYCLDVTSSDELAGARNSLLVLALCITSGMRWPPGHWFLRTPMQWELDLKRRVCFIRQEQNVFQRKCLQVKFGAECK